MCLSNETLPDLRPRSLFSLEGRTAIVTGAAGGIGSWLAAGLGAAGASLLLTDLAEAPLAEIERTLRSNGANVASLALDLADEDAPGRIVDTALKRFGTLDVLVNNAAINRREPILDVDRESWDAITQVNLRAPYFLSQAAARAMIEGGRGGAIVSLSSVNVQFALEHVSVYGLAKGGISQLTRHMAVEWARHGIRANAIAPGLVATPLTAGVLGERDVSRWLRNRVLIDRPGAPTDLVGACLLLASDAGAYLTGQTLVVDGGLTAGGRWFRPDD